MNAKSHLRSVAKAISWRCIAGIDTMVAVTVTIAWQTGQIDLSSAVKIAAGIVGIEFLTKSFLYYIHERLWTTSRIARMFGNVAS